MIQFLVKLKYLFDLGSSFFNLINFCLLAITAGGTISGVLGINNRLLVGIMIPSVPLAVLLFGFVIDRFGYMQRYNKEANQRNNLFKKLEDKL